MHETRFPPWAGDFPVFQTHGSGCSGPRCGGSGAARCTFRRALRCRRDGLCAGLSTRQCGTGDVGIGSHVPAGEWAALRACPGGTWGQGPDPAGRGEPSARRSLGDGGRGGLRGPGRRGGRNSWRAGGAELYRDQAACPSVGGGGGARLAYSFRRPRGAFGGAGKVAPYVAAFRQAPLERSGPRRCLLGGGAFPRARTCARHLEGRP